MAFTRWRAPDLLQRCTGCLRKIAFETAAGSLILRSFCPPSLVASLRADRRLHPFTRVPESEHQLLLGIARQLLSLTLEHPIVEKMILVAVGLSWPWDLKGSGLSPFRYRSLLAYIYEPYYIGETAVSGLCQVLL